ncbi:MAG: hypothetical protein OSA98_23550 [Rubripirellula sp.]|nr:hypothetical protein [Rubripirellula sp.]
MTVEVELECGKLLTAKELKACSLASDDRRTQHLAGILTEDGSAKDLELLAQSHRIGDDGLHRWTLAIRNPRAASHPGGIWELGDANSACIKRATVRFKPLHPPAKDSGKTLHRRLKLSTVDEWQPITGNQLQLNQLASGSPNAPLQIHRDKNGTTHKPIQGFQLIIDGETTEGQRAEPSVILMGETGTALGVHISHFWQKFPQSLSLCTSGDLCCEFLSSSFGRPHEVLPGEQVSCDFLIATGAPKDVQKNLEDYARPNTATVAPDWIASTKVIPWLTARNQKSSLPYLDLVDQAITGNNSFYEKRESIDQYGWRHFGDVWGDHEAIHSAPDKLLVSHYNNQYDMVLGLGINYLRSGDSRWFELMRDLARHVIDIDIYHTDEDRAVYNHGMFWHTVHYVDAGLSTHRTYPKGTCGGGPSSGHAYSRGLYLYYCLTGDVAAKEAVVKLGEWMIASEDGRRTKYRFLAGGETGLTTASGSEYYHGPGRGPANCVEVLVTAFEATNERRFLDQAEHIIRRVVHPDQDIAALDLSDSENKWFYLMFLQALGRYLEIKISLDEIDEMYSYAKLTLLRYADWMAEHEYPFLDKPEKLEFPTETWAAQDMRKVEVFQWAARHASEQQKQTFLEKASFFFKESVRQLNEFETKGLCRPIALLLSNGYSHDFFSSGQLEKMTPSPPASVTTFAPQKSFLSQKTRAIRNAKIIIAISGVLFSILAVVILVILLRR